MGSKSRSFRSQSIEAKPSEITNLTSAIDSKIALQIVLSQINAALGLSQEWSSLGRGGAIAKPSSVSLEPHDDTKAKSL